MIGYLPDTKPSVSFLPPPPTTHPTTPSLHDTNTHDTNGSTNNTVPLYQPIKSNGLQLTTIFSLLFKGREGSVREGGEAPTREDARRPIFVPFSTNYLQPQPTTTTPPPPPQPPQYHHQPSPSASTSSGNRICLQHDPFIPAVSQCCVVKLHG